jgi:hypothetical protein
MRLLSYGLDTIWTLGNLRIDVAQLFSFSSFSLWDGTVRDLEVIWVRPETKYFCKRGWKSKGSRRKRRGTMIPIDAGETLNQLQPTRVLLSPASAPYSSCRQLSSALNTVLGTLTRSSQ